jgi:hypothetical protein
MAQEMDELIAEIERNTQVTASALEFMSSLDAKLAAAQQNPTTLADLRKQLAANSDRIAAAIAANTAAASEAAPGTTAA